MGSVCVWIASCALVALAVRHGIACAVCAVETMLVEAELTLGLHALLEAHRRATLLRILEAQTGSCPQDAAERAWVPPVVASIMDLEQAISGG